VVDIVAHGRGAAQRLVHARGGGVVCRAGAGLHFGGALSERRVVEASPAALDDAIVETRAAVVTSGVDERRDTGRHIEGAQAVRARGVHGRLGAEEVPALVRIGAPGTCLGGAHEVDRRANVLPRTRGRRQGDRAPRIRSRALRPLARADSRRNADIARRRRTEGLAVLARAARLAADAVGVPGLARAPGIATSEAALRTRRAAVGCRALSDAAGGAQLGAVGAKRSSRATLRVRAGGGYAISRRVAAPFCAIHRPTHEPGLGTRCAMLIGADPIGKKTILAVHAEVPTLDAFEALSARAGCVAATVGAHPCVADTGADRGACLSGALPARQRAIFARGVAAALPIRRPGMASARRVTAAARARARAAQRRHADAARGADPARRAGAGAARRGRPPVLAHAVGITATCGASLDAAVRRFSGVGSRVAILPRARVQTRARVRQNGQRRIVPKPRTTTVGHLGIGDNHAAPAPRRQREYACREYAEGGSRTGATHGCRPKCRHQRQTGYHARPYRARRDSYLAPSPPRAPNTQSAIFPDALHTVFMRRSLPMSRTEKARPSRMRARRHAVRLVAADKDVPELVDPRPRVRNCLPDRGSRSLPRFPAGRPCSAGSSGSS
jgi:hypothetical protein